MRLFDYVCLSNFLSFGPDAQRVDLLNLNVVIGPHGSGKSNFVEAFTILQAVSKDLPKPIRQGGGVDDWLWQDGQSKSEQASLEVVFPKGVVDKLGSRSSAIRYRLAFGSEQRAFEIKDERLENEHGNPIPYFYFGYQNHRPMINSKGEEGRYLERAEIDMSQSILTQIRDPKLYPEITSVGDLFKKILIYRSWQFGPTSNLRAPCQIGLPSNVLMEDFSNLPARLAILKKDPKTKRRFLDALRELAPQYEDFEVIPEANSLQLYITEGERNVPAQRLSDGTLRYICLLCILINPGDAKLIVIEEPELGLHPDILPVIRDLMVEASQHTQLVVTTHSTQLVDAMSDYAQFVLVCEKDGATSSLTRLDQNEISHWRAFGSLGQLWMQGHLGGTRW